MVSRLVPQRLLYIAVKTSSPGTRKRYDREFTDTITSVFSVTTQWTRRGHDKAAHRIHVAAIDCYCSNHRTVPGTNHRRAPARSHARESRAAGAESGDR